MKLTFSLLVIVVCLFACAQTVDAQNLYGRTTVHYDENTRYMTATASTEVDFLAQEFYQGYVNIRLSDGNGNDMAVAVVGDTDRDGFVQYSNQFAAGPDGSEYTLTSKHIERA